VASIHVLPRVSHALTPTEEYVFGVTRVILTGKHPGDVGPTKEPASQAMIAGVAETFGVTDLFAINPSQFNGRVVAADPAYFEKHALHGGVSVHFETYVDGVVGLIPGQAFWMRSGDCPTIFLVGHGEVAALHGGLHSILTPYWKDGFAATPNRPSVVQAGVARMSTRPDQLQARIICGAGADGYVLKMDHPVHGRHNHRLMQEVRARWGRQCIRRLSGALHALSIPHPCRFRI
jgi:hypothetical protein